MNTFGRVLRLTAFGESHGAAIGGVLDGFPAGVTIDLQLLEQAMSRRSPLQAGIGSGRGEADKVEILSGVYRGRSIGSPLAFLIRNTDARSEDYAALEKAFRPGHADDTWFSKYGLRDWRGGGRASARTTAVSVAAGAFARMFLNETDCARRPEIFAYTEQIGEVVLARETRLDWENIYDYPSRCPHKETDARIREALRQCREEGDSLGGIVRCVVKNMPRNSGEPIFDKLSARLAQVMMGIPAARGFEIGMGFNAAAVRGSLHNDTWCRNGTTARNIAGGVRGGISTGEDLLFRVAFKPVASIAKEQNLLGEDGELHPHALPGRHDVCCVPRAVSVVEALTTLTLADFLLLNRLSQK